jgi:hypothetical protein
MAKKKKPASFATRLLDLILPPVKKKKKKKRKQQQQQQRRRPDAQPQPTAQPRPEEEPHATAHRGLARLMAHTQAQQGHRAAEALNAVGGPLAALETALGVIDSVQSLIREAEELIASARESDVGRRALLAERYDEIRLELERIIRETSESEVPLIGQGAKGIRVPVGNGKKLVAIRPINLETGPEGGLDLPPPETAFEENDELDAIERKLLATSGRIARAAEVFVADAALLSSSVLGGSQPEAAPASEPAALTHR